MTWGTSFIVVETERPTQYVFFNSVCNGWRMNSVLVLFPHPGLQHCSSICSNRPFVALEYLPFAVYTTHAVFYRHSMLHTTVLSLLCFQEIQQIQYNSNLYPPSAAFIMTSTQNLLIVASDFKSAILDICSSAIFYFRTDCFHCGWLLPSSTTNAIALDRYHKSAAVIL